MIHNETTKKLEEKTGHSATFVTTKNYMNYAESEVYPASPMKRPKDFVTIIKQYLFDNYMLMGD
jgi:hypothetical protein